MVEMERVVEMGRVVEMRVVEKRVVEMGRVLWVVGREPR